MEDWRSKRSLALKLLMPLIFLLPIALPSVPVQIKASMLPLAALFLGVFGAAIGLVKMREGHMLPRLAILPVPAYRLMVGYLAANALTDAMQLAAPFIAAAYLLGLGVGAIATAAVVLLSAILSANALGALVAILAGSSGEVHLLAALTVLLMGGASGLFISGGSAASIAEILPFASLSSVMASSATPGLIALSVLFSILLLVLTLLTSYRFFGGRSSA